MLSLDGLNPPQRAAVLHGEGPLVVFAGAGSGKTRVITTRIAHLVIDRGVDPGAILAVTFTNKAAAEMRSRLYPMLGGRARLLTVGTFHSTSARLLRDYSERIGIPRDFVVYDDQDQLAMLKRICRDLELDEDQTPPKKLAHRIDAAKNELRGPGDAEGFDPMSEALARVYPEYERRMRAAGALDFGDLIVVLVRALEADASLRAELTDRFRHLLVDEFQDTNHAQLRLVQAMCGPHRNITVVGDDDQSIYRWRGADRRNILDFRRHFGEAAVVKLEQNYRSTQRILSVAYEVIRRADEREEKRLYTENGDGDPVLVVRHATERDEAAMVARGVAELVDHGVPLSEVAVFYRTHAQSRVLEEHVMARGLPYRVVGGARFFERAEVKDVLAYLRLLVNPADDVSLLRIVNVPARGIGKTTVDKLAAEAVRRGQPVLATLREAVEGGGFPKAATGKLMAFVELVKELEAMRASGDDPSVIAREVIERSGYRAMLTDDDTAESDARLQNLGELVSAIAEYEAGDDAPTLTGFLERVTLDLGQEDAAGAERLTLMTVHAAKGLEFDVVMVTGMEEDIFPSRSLQDFDREALDEERRLAYVAFTRARKRLVLSHVDLRRLYGTPRDQQASRFLREVKHLTQAIDARPAHLRFERAQAGSPGGGYGQRRFGGSAGGGWGSSAAAGHAGSGRDPFDEGAAERHGFQAPAAWDEGMDAPPPRRSGGGESYVDRDEGDLGLDALRVGSRVRHPKFGAGVVRSVDRGLPPKAVVAFESVGEKTVVVSFLALAR